MTRFDVSRTMKVTVRPVTMVIVDRRAGMRRRDFVTRLAIVIATPRALRAQGRIPVVGILGTASADAMKPWVAAFEQRLRELGWTESRATIQLRWANSQPQRISEIADEFVRQKVDIIVTTGTSVPVITRLTSTIPIVFAIANDPIGAGLVASLARPGANVTGLSQLAADLGGKRLEILREILPNVKRLAILGDAGNQATVPEMRHTQDAANSLGLQSELLDVRRAEDIGSAIEALKGKTDALYVQSGPLMNSNRVRISTHALGIGLPTLSGIRDYVDAGALMSYGPNFPDMFRRAADFTDKILRGAKPADIPVEQPTKFELVFNMTTARVLGLKISESFLLRVDALVE
jgi:putative ABC transport system substrate-binding protein